MSGRLNNKVAIVTGASSGIGASIAIYLANEGALVVGLARRVDLIQSLNDGITGKGRIIARICDLTNEQELVEAFKWARDTFSTIHILVNNAGINKANFLTESCSTDIKELFDINVIATTLCLREGLRHMRETNAQGHIIVINSILGHRIPQVPIPLFSVYPATKHAITALCQTVRQEIQFHKLNIKLTSINPGMVDTDFLKVYSNGAAFLPKLKPNDVAEAVIYALNTTENVQVEDINLQAMP